MKRATAVDLVALAAGALFAAGLALSGMSNPRKVLAFLDLAGAWDPSLACVMGGALAVHSIAVRRQRRQARPIYNDAFSLPDQSQIDGRLIGGAALFGVGWGMAGYCPGPALFSLVSGNLGCIVFVLCMLLGMGLVSRAEPSGALPQPTPR
jgi:uncharacterized membrane protein YedE/YeeE